MRLKSLSMAIVLSVWGTASLAASKDDVAQAQRYLNKLGYDAGVVDGLWGSENTGCVGGVLGRPKSGV